MKLKEVNKLSITGFVDFIFDESPYTSRGKLASAAEKGLAKLAAEHGYTFDKREETIRDSKGDIVAAFYRTGFAVKDKTPSNIRESIFHALFSKEKASLDQLLGMYSIKHGKLKADEYGVEASEEADKGVA
jgi:hypothetical protein